jgi:branched-chain amino acid aminotransferase
MEIKITPVSKSRVNDLDLSTAVFGKVFSDHMLVADFENGNWKEPEIVPYGRMELSPSISALHYGQAIFEGMKAYKNEAGDILLFRAADNHKRLNISAERMCMPSVPEEIFIGGLKKLIQLDKNWILPGDENALYIRPVYFATDEALGVKSSEKYRFVIITCPSAGGFYPEPLKVFIEKKYSRSSEGGTGYAKAAGNYGGAMYPTKLAMKKGYHQLIWTDASENKYIEESGSMNIMMVVEETLITPSLSHSKLAGITRDSILALARSWNMKVEERNVSVDELISWIDKGQLKECFGVGTAAQVAHIAVIGHEEKQYTLPPVEKMEFSNKIARHLIAIKKGREKDLFSWVTRA